MPSIKIIRLLDPSLNKTLAKICEQPLPFASALRLKTLVLVIRAAQQQYEERRQEILQECGDKDAAGEIKIDQTGKVVLTPDNLDKFHEAMTELAKIDITLPTISISDLQETRLSVNDMFSMDAILHDTK